jgi:hypothetical protein
MVVGKLRFEGADRGVIRPGDWELLKPTALAVLDELSAEHPEEYFAGKAALSLYRFLSRGYDERLLLASQVPELERVMWQWHDELDRFMQSAPSLDG